MEPCSVSLDRTGLGPRERTRKPCRVGSLDTVPIPPMTSSLAISSQANRAHVWGPACGWDHVSSHMLRFLLELLPGIRSLNWDPVLPHKASLRVEPSSVPVDGYLIWFQVLVPAFFLEPCLLSDSTLLLPWVFTACMTSDPLFHSLQAEWIWVYCWM